MSAPARRPRVDVVVPVHDEQRALPASIRRLHDVLSGQLPFAWRIVIADNASTDDTLALAYDLAFELPYVDVLHLDEKGRGRALRAAWSRSEAEVVCYMDVDLSTDLRALLPLVAPLLSGHSDVAIGTRLARGARVVRTPKREFISRSYNRILRLALRARFSDAQCGFKAVRRDVAEQLLRDVRDDGWFFDTELLVLAQRRGLRIHEVPVDWVDDPDSRVDIVRTAVDDLRGVGRLALGTPIAAKRTGREAASRRATPFRSASAVGTMSTRVSGSSTQSTGTSWMRSPSRWARTSSSVSKNQASSSTRGSRVRAVSARSALKPHCASENRVASVAFSSRL